MFLIPLFVLLCLIRLTLSGDGAQWDYEAWDIAIWKNTYPLCGAGDASPINIDTDTAFVLEELCTSEFEWDIDSDHNTFRVTNNGHTIIVV